MAAKIRVTVWNENRHEKADAKVSAVYPKGIHGAIAAGLSKEPDMTVRTATLDEPQHGLTDEALAATDVLTWWGHMAHGEVKDEIADKVQKRVHEGMGLIVLHSGHMSKPFVRLMGTSCLLRWREAGEKERLWVVEPGHPIVDGLGPFFEIPHEEMYGERFDIPSPESTVFISWFARRQRVQVRLLLYPGQGKDLLFPPRPRDVPHVLPEGGADRDQERGPMGGAGQRSGDEARRLRGAPGKAIEEGGRLNHGGHEGGMGRDRGDGTVDVRAPVEGRASRCAHHADPRKGRRPAGRGRPWRSTARDVAAASDIVFTMVGFPSELEEVCLGPAGILAGARPGLIFCDMSTSEPSLAVRIHEAAKERSVAALDAPVSGGDVGAREARLAIMVGGEQEVYDKVLPLFRKMGETIALMGGPGAGQHTKMANQITIAGTMIGTVESLLYAHKAGLGMNAVIDIIGKGAASSWSLNNLGRRIAGGDFNPGFYIKHFVKDMGIALQEARKMKLSLPGLALVNQFYIAAQAMGLENLGTHALYKVMAAMNG